MGKDLTPRDSAGNSLNFAFYRHARAPDALLNSLSTDRNEGAGTLQVPGSLPAQEEPQPPPVHNQTGSTPSRKKNLKIELIKEAMEKEEMSPLKISKQVSSSQEVPGKL